MEMKYLKWLNMIPLIMFFIVDKLRGTLISRYSLIIIVVLGVMNTLIPLGTAYAMWIGMGIVGLKLLSKEA